MYTLYYWNSTYNTYDVLLYTHIGSNAATPREIRPTLAGLSNDFYPLRLLSSVPVFLFTFYGSARNIHLSNSIIKFRGLPRHIRGRPSLLMSRSSLERSGSRINPCVADRSLVFYDLAQNLV